MDQQKAGVIRFYDTHPINEDEILAKLRARGDDPDHLTQDQLKDFDQDHYGGIDVVDALAERAGIQAAHHVLDVCSGMGGPHAGWPIASAAVSRESISPFRGWRQRNA